MATRKQKIRFAIKRFKGFWSQFRRSKRGMIGLAIVIFFCIIAIFAPVIAPYAPIDPQLNPGEYPKLGSRGIPIAEELCKPIWYKYLPTIRRGPREVTQRFYSELHTELGLTYQVFRREGEENATHTTLLLSNRVVSIEEIKATLPNGTEIILSKDDWDFQLSGGKYRLNEIRIFPFYPNNTMIEVKYITAWDLAENIDVIEDHKFTSIESFNEWKWWSNSNLVEVRYNTEEGFPVNEEDNLGCVEIFYESVREPSSQPIEVTLAKSFEYPYYQPPVSFWIHYSVKVEGIPAAKVKVAFLKEEGNETRTFLLKTLDVLSSKSYTHYVTDSGEGIVATNVGADIPQNLIFASPGNYSFVVQVIIPSGSLHARIYLDNIDCMLYGNTFGLLGTDNGSPFPRDLFSLLVHGSRVSLFVGTLTAIFSTLIGLFLGLVSGYIGGIVDEAIMRFADLLLVLPTLPLFIILVVALRTVRGSVSMWNIIIILTFFGWMSFARSVRSMVLSLRERTFVEAAKAAGAGTFHIINRHILPNVFALVYITLATSVPGAIITEASLSWLGLGDPLLPSWGKILYDFQSSNIAITTGLTEYWFWVFPACIAIATLATAFILVGYALDEILNPRLRERR